MDGVPQLLAYAAAAALCVVRPPPSHSGRMVSRLVPAGGMSFGLSNVDRYESLVRTLDPLPLTVLCQVLRAAFYICVLIAIVRAVQSRLDRLPLTLALDGLVVGLGAGTMAALSASALGGGFAPSAMTLGRPVADLVLLALTFGSVSLFCWRPPPSLWLLAGSLLVF